MTRTLLRGLLFALLAAGLSVGAVRPGAAQQAQPALTINQVDGEAYPNLRAVVTPLDANGVPARALTKDQFQAFDGDTPLTVSAVQTAQDANVPLAVVLTIDVSGSMAGDPIDRAKQAATEFVSNVGPKDLVAVVAFSDKVTSVADFTNDKSKLTTAIAGLQANGGTALFEAVQVSSYAAHAPAGVRRAVVLLTDGQNDSPDSQATNDGSLAAAQGAAVPVFTVAFGSATDTAYLRLVSAVTQGQYRSATAATVSSVYADIAALLRAQYVITLKSAAPADGKSASLRIIANVAGAPAAALSTYTRGKAPVVVAPVGSQPSAAPTAAQGAANGSGSNVPLIVFSAIIAIAALAGAGYWFARLRSRRRLLEQQRQVVAPNQRQAAAQPLPARANTGVPVFTPTEGHGRLVEKSMNGAGKVYELGAGPFAIGSSAKLSSLVLPAEDDVAPEHVRITRLNGTYRLHHTGGVARKTLVGGRPADFLTLEAGDEIQVGRHRFVFEEPAAEVPASG